LVEFTLSAIDPEDDSMTISMYEGPDGAHFDSSSWTASWYPLQSGNYVVKFRILDARGASATTEVNITVLEPDQPIVRISATASDWSGIATEQAELTLDVQLCLIRNQIYALIYLAHWCGMISLRAIML